MMWNWLKRRVRRSGMIQHDITTSKVQYVEETDGGKLFAILKESIANKECE